MLFTIWLILAIATGSAILLNISNQKLGKLTKEEFGVAIFFGIFWPVFIPFVIIARLLR